MQLCYHQLQRNEREFEVNAIDSSKSSNGKKRMWVRVIEALMSLIFFFFFLVLVGSSWFEWIYWYE